MGESAWGKIEKLCKNYLNDRQGQDVSVGWLRRIVAVAVGADARTIDSYMRLMADFKIIRASKQPNKVTILERPK